MLTLQEYVLPLSIVAIPNSSSLSERVVSITAPWEEQMRMAFLGRADFLVIVNLIPECLLWELREVAVRLPEPSCVAARTTLYLNGSNRACEAATRGGCQAGRKRGAQIRGAKPRQGTKLNFLFAFEVSYRGLKLMM
jgi:hypothetical protein